MNELALFAGAGGGILGGKLLGWRTVCAVEQNPYCISVLAQRQNEGILPPFPIWDDVCTFDGTIWRGTVDVVSGGFPCQDISTSGRGAGINGERSGLWREMSRIIREVQPTWVFAENSPALTSRGIEVVLRDLAEMGYDAEWGVLGASDVGANHKRKRIWIVGKAQREVLADPTSQRQHQSGEPLFPICTEADEKGEADNAEYVRVGENWRIEPRLDRVAYGVAYRMDRLKAIGNGQVPLVAAEAFRILSGRLIE